MTGLQWYTVSGSMEIEELVMQGRCRELSTDSRHGLFLKIKHPNTKFYRGSWGPELLHLTDYGPYKGYMGEIWCTYKRYTEIAEWFLQNLYP